MEKAKGDNPQTAEIRHLVRPRALSAAELRMRDMELSIAHHFQDQNRLLAEANKGLSDKIQRLTNSVENLVAQMDGVRTGRKEEAFARVCSADGDPDLPSVSAEAALIYTLTAKQIGEQLGFHASQIGLILGKKGLGWVGNGDFQEIGRTVSASQSKFWHSEVPARLQRILDEQNPAQYQIKEKVVLAIFRRWKERNDQAKLFAQDEGSQTH